MKQIVKEREEEFLFQFLMGLDNTLYGTIRSNILGQKPLPSLSTAFSNVIQEERHHQMMREKEERVDAVSFALNSLNIADNKKQNSNSYDKVICSHCKKTGHEVKNCCQLHGYPEHWNSNRGRGGRCGGRGRGIGQGRGMGRSMNVVANAAPSPGDSSIQNTPITNRDQTHFSGLSNEEWNAIANLLEQYKPTSASNEQLTGKSSLSDWLIDSGASYHMTGN